MKKTIALLIAAAMATAVFSACGDSDRQTGSQTESTVSQTAAVDEDLAEIINDAGTIGEGTAGSSLKSAKLAHDLAALAAEKGYTEEDIDSLRSTFETTINAMDENAKSSVNSVFNNSVFPMLDSMIDGGSSALYKGLLEDAGVGGDMDSILKTPGLAESYNSIKSAFPKN